MSAQNKLAQKRCAPCEGGIPPFSVVQTKRYLKQLSWGWRIDNNQLHKIFKFSNFVEAMGFANQVALVAQAEDHHPNLEISYREVKIILWTHAAKGLTENDFIMAAKIDLL